MTVNFFILFLSYLLITISVIGYGKLYCKFFLSNQDLNIGFEGFYGLFILIIYSYISHFVFPHTLEHNIFFLILGLLFYFFFRRKKINKTYILIISLNFLVLFIALLIFKTHDDFPYYHFAYSYYLTQEPLLIGIGQFNHGFRTPSSIFYLNSLYYLPFIKYYSFYIPTLLFYSFANLIFAFFLYENLKKKNFNYIFFLNILFLIFINIFFYRLQEHGTDRSAQILISILFLQIFQLIEYKKNFKKEINHILMLLGLIISLKAFYILYLIIFFPLILILYNDKKINFITYLLSEKIFYIFFGLILLIISTYFFNTGCLIYPLSISCFDNFQWSIGINDTLKMNEHYQLWSKAGKTPNFFVTDPENYLSNFNWVSNWIELYFFNKVLDFILGLLLLSIIVLCAFYKNGNKIIDNKKIKNIIFVYLVIFLLFIEWFTNHPALRYGGYILIALLIFVPLSIYLENNHTNKNKIFSRLKILLIITIIIFLVRNLSRINNEMTRYDYKPLKDSFYYVDQNHFRLQNSIENLIQNYKICKNKLKSCDTGVKKKIREIYPERYLFVYD